MQRGIAAVNQSSRAAFVDQPEPAAPAHGQALCRTLELGVCGTDREILASTSPLTPPGETFLVLGHECLARVEAIGLGVQNLQSGQLVVPTVRRRISQADASESIRIDMLNFGDYTERGIVRQHGFSVPRWVDDAEYLLSIDETLASVAVLAEPQAVAEKAVNEAVLIQQARLNDSTWKSQPPRVLVTGMGPIAFAAVLACVARDWPVTLVGRDERDTFRAKLVEQFHATYATAERLVIETNRLEQQGFDLLLECTGSDKMMLQAATSLAARGVGVWLGASRVPQPANHNVAQLMRGAIVRNQIFLGTVNAAPRDFADALINLAKLNTSHPKAMADLITARVRPEDALEHFNHRVAQGIKTVVMYE